VNAMGSNTISGNVDVGTFGSNFYGNNVYFTSWPNIDSRGVVLVGASNFVEEQETGIVGEGSAGTNVIRAFSDPYGNFLEYLWDPQYGYIWTNNGGYANFLATSSSSYSASTYGTTCQYQAGTPATYSYCYYLSTPSASSYAYGLLTANGASSRQGRADGYAVTAMSGVRVFTKGSTVTAQNIMNVQYPNQDLQYGSANDNLIWMSAPKLDDVGLTFRLNGGVVGPNGAAVDSDINLWIDVTTPGYGSGANGAYAGMFEWSGNYTDAALGFEFSSTTFDFSWSKYNGGNTLQACSAVAPTIPQLTTYSFCYGVKGTAQGGYQIGVQGTITTYGTPITVGGRTGYAVAAMAGTRRYTDGQGRDFTSQIIGPSSDWIAEEQGWTYDQIFFPTAPYFSGQGLLYKFTGGQQQTGRFSDPVARVAYTNGAFGEEIYFNNGQVNYTGATLSVVADNGASAGTILGSCGIAFSSSSAPAPRPTSSSSSGVNGGGGTTDSSNGGSGLSGGAIAGIVIGSVVGAALLCLLCVGAVFCARGNKKAAGDGESRNGSTYDSQQDISRVGQSQVELQSTAADESELEAEHETV